MDLKAWRGFSFVDPNFLNNVKLALALGDTGIAVTKNDDVFVVNVNGLLEISRLDSNAAEPEPPVRIDDLCQKGVKDLVKGNGFFLSLTQCGRLWVVGKLALERACNDDLHPMIPVAVGGQLRDKLVVKAACGFKHVLALTDQGEVYAFGCNEDGRVGIPVVVSGGAREIKRPVKVNFNEGESKIIAVACGRDFSVALAETGNVYCWGSNTGGQLGLPVEVSHCSTPTKLETNLRFQQVVCGPRYVVGLTTEGHCYLWGRSSRPSVCHETNTRPVRVGEFLQGIVEVAAMKYDDMCALKAKDGVYVWGNTRLKGDFDRVHPHCVDFPSTDLAFAYWSRHFAMWRPYRISSAVAAVGATIPRPLLSEILQPGDGILKIPSARIKYCTDETGDPIVLGEGIGGVVYQGNFDGYLVAVKKLHQSGKRDWKRTVLRELQALAAVGGHENVLRLVGVTEIRNQMPVDDICVVTELCELGDLRTFLVKHKGFFVNQLKTSSSGRKDPIVCSPANGIISPYVQQANSSWVVTTTDLLRWAYEFACGMEFLASQKIIHGDLALRNLLLNGNRTLKVSDFGFSRRIRNDNYYIMSNHYVPWATRAPESFDSGKLYTSSDVWGYGVTLWEMFTLGDLPYKDFEAKNHPEGFFHAVKNGLRLGLPPFAPPTVYKIMVSCWELEQDRRPSFKTLVDLMRGELSQDTFSNHPTS